MLRNVAFCVLVAITAASEPPTTDGFREFPTSLMFGSYGPDDIAPSDVERLMAESTRTGYSSRNKLMKVRARDGDMRLTIAQYNRLHGKGNQRSGFKAEADLSKRWTDNVMPYTFAAHTFSDNEKDDIREAMEMLSNLTCIQFREKRDSDKNWVRFQDNGSGCNSELGMGGYGEQQLNLDVNGCRWNGLYLHEIGHALGLIHEHQRPDRDDHLKVLWRRVEPDFIHAFDKYAANSVNYYNTEYDPSSVMHYEDIAFSANNEPTIILKEKWKRKYLTRVYFKTLSWTDTKILNEMYKCGARCNKRCPGKSYLDKNCNCISPENIYNELCYDEISPRRYCTDRLMANSCGGDHAAESNFKCRKTCDSCPKYGRDHILRPLYDARMDTWGNLHPDDAECDMWAEKQYCRAFRPSWMKRHCRKSCGEWFCKREGVPASDCERWFAEFFPMGKCRNTFNVFDDMFCDGIAKQGKCHIKKYKAECADSCQECGYQYPGDCENMDNDSDCDRRAKRGDCDGDDMRVAIQTQTRCRKSCNSCGFNEGRCENTLESSDPDYECGKAAIEGKCITEHEVYKEKCRKTCNSCEYNKIGQCENEPEARGSCYWLRKLDECQLDRNNGYARHFCGKDCNKCAYQQNPPCEDLSSRCKDYDKEECINNAKFMFINCKKTCGVCHKFAPGACENRGVDALCEAVAKRGECDAPGLQHKLWCRRSCGLCQAPPIQFECRDTMPKNCAYWKKKGVCDDPAHRQRLNDLCPVSCGGCQP